MEPPEVDEAALALPKAKDVLQLRQFPVVYRASAKVQQRGMMDGVYFEQTMGRMMLICPLEKTDTELDEDNFKVEMSCWKIVVSKRVAGCDSKLFDQETCGDIHRDLSWWKVDRADAAGINARCLVIHLAKVRHSLWAGPWYPGGLNPHKKLHFPWTELQGPKDILKGLKIDVEALKNIEPGEPEDWNHEISAAMTPEQLCTGIDIRESEGLLQVVIHLDDGALEGATGRVPLEELFAADISEDELSVFLRGDGFQICTGRFTQKVVPEMSAWQIRSVRRKNLPEDCAVKSPAFFNPALRITLTKAKMCVGKWDEIFQDFQHCPFGYPRDRLDWSDRVNRCMVLLPGSPSNKVGKAKRAQALVTRVEGKQDLLLNRVVLLFHLEDKLAWLCESQRVNMHDLFTFLVLSCFGCDGPKRSQQHDSPWRFHQVAKPDVPNIAGITCHGRPHKSSRFASTRRPRMVLKQVAPQSAAQLGSDIKQWQQGVEPRIVSASSEPLLLQRAAGRLLLAS
ncbi:unnamed protein product [Effrenium voratum]|nr:unnamed protein product [Effrenium voratum]